VEELRPVDRRERQFRALDAYVEQASEIGGDPQKDREAKALAMDRAGFLRAQTLEAKVKHFNRIWRGDDARAYICELWAIENEDAPDPISFATRVLRGHMEQTDDSWGPRDRTASLQATAQFVKIFVPAQTMKVDTRSVVARIERPAEFDVEPKMESRGILPAGQVIAKPVSPSGDDPDDENDDEGDDDE
jgi:hypothetical protein